jgi:hypothetical protein
VGAAAGGVGGLLMATEKNSGKSESRWRFVFFIFWRYLLIATGRNSGKSGCMYTELHF